MPIRHPRYLLQQLKNGCKGYFSCNNTTTINEYIGGGSSPQFQVVAYIRSNDTSNKNNIRSSTSNHIVPEAPTQCKQYHRQQQQDRNQPDHFSNNGDDKKKQLQCCHPIVSPSSSSAASTPNSNNTFNFP